MELIVELIVELTVELYSTVSTAPVTRPRPTDVVEHSQLQYTPHVRRRCFYSMQKSCRVHLEGEGIHMHEVSEQGRVTV